MKELVLWVIDKITGIFPGLLLRLVYPPKKVAKQVVIELRGEMPVNLSLGACVPRIDLYLEVINLSNLDLVLDRMLIDLWFGQPTLNAAVLEHHRIPARSIYKHVIARSDLTAQQTKQIEPYTAQSPPSGSIMLNVHSYFTTKVGTVEVETRFERRKV